MRDRNRASFTADAACAARAHGAMNPDPKLRNPDHLAPKLVGMPFRLMLWPILRKNFQRMYEKRAAGVYCLHQARTKRFDAIVSDEIDGGIAQLVVLGAGFDSRAYRFADRLRGARVFEVDHPATSAEKRRRVKKVLGAEPKHVTYVTVDFAREALADKLAAAGFERGKRTFFLWEGVTMYLTAPAIDAMLAYVASVGAGSSIAFDYMWRSALERPDAAIQKQLDLAASYGEPYQFGVDPGDVAALFAKNGLSLVSNALRDDLMRYVIGSDGKPWGEMIECFGIAHGRAT